MKCPYCKREHPEGTKFCPETGEKMPTKIVVIGCPKQGCPNYGRNDIPAHYNYCPECGSPLIGEVPPPPGRDIAYNGVILGKTSLQDLRYMGVEVHFDQGSYFALLNEEFEIMVSIFRLKPDEFEEYKNKFSEVGVPNKECFLNKHNIVNTLCFKSLNHCTILNDFYINDDSDEDEIVDILEDNGWMRIENPYKNEDDDEDDDMFFVRLLPDALGNMVFLAINLYDYSERPQVAFFTNFFKEWKSYSTGVIYKM